MRKIKDFKKFLIERNLMLDIAEPNTETFELISDSYIKMYFNQILMEDVVKEDVNENRDDVLSKISNGSWSTNPQEFLNSVNSSKRVEFLTPYTIEELSTFKLFKLEGYNIGFALKGDDIILVHNNEKIGGIGKLLMNKSIEFGGARLDHYDGFLTGFYKSLDFVVESNDYFMDEYAPVDWKYIPIDINDENMSIYASEIVVRETAFEKAQLRYENGKPDVVYRILK